MRKASAQFILTAALATFVGAYALAPSPTPKPHATDPTSLRISQRSDDVYYARCADARAAGAAPIYAGEPGYREGLDGDGDGIACEPFHGQR